MSDVKKCDKCGAIYSCDENTRVTITVAKQYTGAFGTYPEEYRSDLCKKCSNELLKFLEVK